MFKSGLYIMSNQNITYQIQKIMIIYRIFVGVKLDNRYKKLGML